MNPQIKLKLIREITQEMQLSEQATEEFAKENGYSGNSAFLLGTTKEKVNIWARKIARILELEVKEMS